MKQSEPAKEYLIDHGWNYKGTCNCSGMYTLKFELKTENGSYNLRLRSAHFLIDKPGKRFTKFSIKELKPIVNELFEKYRIVTEAETKIQSVSK